MPDEESLRTVVERHFRVYDARSESIQGQTVADLFFLMFPPEEFDARYEACRRELLDRDPELLVFHRREGGEDVLFVARRPELPPRRVRLNVLFLLLTLVTTVWAGALYWQGFTHSTTRWGMADIWTADNLLWGSITFALPLMFILGVHESAHYIAAKRHGLRASLPFFIPFPPIAFPIGTLGAFISLKDPMPDRKALFDVGASGPLAGFVVAVPLLLLGAMLTGQAAIDVPDLDRPDIRAEGNFTVDSHASGKAVLTLHDLTPRTTVLSVAADPDGYDTWRYTAHAVIKVNVSGDGTAEDDGDKDGEAADDGIREDTYAGRLEPGETEVRTLVVPPNATAVTVTYTWDDGLIHFGDPLLVDAVSPFFQNDDYLTHPLFFAGWVGLLVTGINLLPAGQLDGGHVARAVLGDRARYAAYAAVGLLAFLALRFQSWILMALFILLMGLHHPPPLNDRTPLDRKRRVLAAVTLVVLVVTFVARPIIF